MPALLRLLQTLCFGVLRMPALLRLLQTNCAFFLRSLLLALCLLSASPALPGSGAHAANNDPIVLVHGFLGFGPDQFADSHFLYWGGYGDLAAHLRAYQGPHTVFTAVVGAIASNRQRAAELYAQLKGGCVAPAPPSAQAPRCWAHDPTRNPQGYPAALYPEWDASHPLHMIGHSQGGTTIRALVELLEHGAADAATEGLTRGGKIGWVRSVTTISTPHNGTTLRDAVLDMLPALGAPLRNWLLADLRNWELAPDGARSFNDWARTSPHVVYFSLATQATAAGARCCNATDRLLFPVQDARYQYPRTDMFSYYKSFAGQWILPSMLRPGMGSYTQQQAGRVPVDAGWFPNDGVVNTISMRAPAGHPVRAFDGNAPPGIWHFLGTYQGYDHFDVLGWPHEGPSADPIYERISTLLFAL